MSIRYKIDILAALKNAGYSTYKLRKEKVFGERTIQKFRDGEIVTADNLSLICQLLECDIGDILTYYKDELTEEQEKPENLTEENETTEQEETAG